jgi:hypothetical protein
MRLWSVVLQGILRATQLVNNNMLANMYAFKRTVEQTKESGNESVCEPCKKNGEIQ